MPLTNIQRINRISIPVIDMKLKIKNDLQKECDNLNIVYNESDNNSELCEKINNS